MKCKTLPPFVNTFTAHDKYSVLNRQYLQHPIQMQVSEKQKISSDFFAAFLKSRSNFEHIQKKMTLIANVFPELRTFKSPVRYISKEYRFRVPLEKQHGKRTQTLLKSKGRHLYHIY